MIFASPLALDPARARIGALYRADEATVVRDLLERTDLPERRWQRIEAEARRLIEAVRGNRRNEGGLDAFLQEYGLDSAEGVVLLCLAEALLRIPDADTQDRLIRDKMVAADWAGHLGHSDSLLVNASTWAMMLTGRLLRWGVAGARGIEGA